MRDGGVDPRNGNHLDPILRELLVFDVVSRDPSDGRWHLSEQAHQRLDQLATPRPPAEKLIYFGHRCSVCRQLRPTRLRAHGLVCEECVTVTTAAWGHQQHPDQTSSELTA
jgi:hypothetical protein